MSRLAKLASGCAHQRRIDMSTFPVDETHILVKGRFIEERLRPYYKLTGEKIEAGPLHNLEILVLVRVPDLVIEDIEVVAGTLPRGDCYEITGSLEQVKGMSIRRGFTANVKYLFEGVAGCTHLTHLLCTMAPAILQGYWAINSSKKPDIKEQRRKQDSRMADFLRDNCYTWRRDGEAYQKMLRLLDGEDG
ncbi:MAG TPA: DUF2889 domain-containing protein [Spirochaetota bacterium]|nr:DUF2889 domain-containing protein [Spirochaetota bacterium]HPJ36096.1 DUF2889 domain-containing protein [Spirochaetota bacterium]